MPFIADRSDPRCQLQRGPTSLEGSRAPSPQLDASKTFANDASTLFEPFPPREM